MSKAETNITPEVRVTRGEVLRMLRDRGVNLSHDTVWRLMKGGEIPCLLIRGRYQALPSDVNVWIDRTLAEAEQR